jgi:mono/diheme cytochrome c family protein
LTAVFVRILGFVILIAGFYGGIGNLWLTQTEEHPPPELQIAIDTDIDTLIGMGETLVKTKGGCLLCHKITEVGNTRGPDLRGVGGRAATRKPGLSAEAYLMESLLEPGAYVVEEFAAAGGTSIMPAADLPPADMSATELKALVAFLQSMSGEVTVAITEKDIEAATAKKQAPKSPEPTHPGFVLMTAQGCRACHDVIGTSRLIGPPLTTVGERLSAAEIRQSIVDPNAVIAEGFQAGLMLQDFGEKLSAEELDQLVSYLSGEVSLSERLSHPAVHLAFLILLFNAGIFGAIRMAPAPDQVTATAVVTEPVAEPSSERVVVTSGEPSSGSTAGLIASIVFAIGLFFWWLADPPKKPAVVEQARTVAQTQTLAQAETAGPPDGKSLFSVTCTACHGKDAKGLPGLGKDMTTSEFIASKSDAELAEFIKQGRAVDDPLNTTGVPMPPMGANPALTDDDLLAVVQFIRSLRK